MITKLSALPEGLLHCQSMHASLAIWSDGCTVYAFGVSICNELS